MVTLDYLSAVRFSGADAGQFLHNQLSADVLALASGDSIFACYCEPKGRVLALMLVYRVDDDYYVIMSRSLAPAVTERLKIYVMRSQVSIELLDASTVSGFQENDAPELALMSAHAIPLPGSDRWLAVTDHEITPATTASSQAAWKISELQKGITWLNPETSGQFLPQMLGFDQLGAVNFRKGCYPGQEIVARTHYLGKLKRHPRVLCTEAEIHPAPLEKIQINSSDQPHEAVVVDCEYKEAEQSCLLVVTRMGTDLKAQSIEYQGTTTPLKVF